MDEMPSAEFRKTYAKLRKSVVVTVNGHGIGIWHPTSEVPTEAISPFMSEPNTPERYDEIQARVAAPTRKAAQAQRDEWLRRMAKGSGKHRHSPFAFRV